MGQHDALGLSGRARGGDDEGIAVLDPDAVGHCMLLPIGADNPRRTQRVEQDLAGDRREAGIEGSGGIAGVPHGAQGIDKAHPTREVECDELRHRPVA